MSHFTVLVVGSDYKKQLEKYWELDLKEEDAIKDPRSVFNDKTDEYLDEYQNKTIEKVLMPDGRELFKWDEEFLVQNPKNPLCKNTVIPENLEIKKYKFSELYETFDIFMTEWHGSTKLSNGRYGYYYNPNAKWDWYQVGGRWNGFFKLKEGITGECGKPGVFGDKRESLSGRADIARKGDIDFEGMRSEYVDECYADYVKFHDIVSGREIPKWSEFLEKYNNIEEARDSYWENEVIKDLTKNKFFDFEYFIKPKDEFLKWARNNAIATYALLYQGNWHEKGEMGWFGISSNEKNEDLWLEEFNNILDSLPDDEILTIVDCHI